MSRPTQVERVLALLRRRGRAGITQLDMLGPAVIDGGPPVWRLPARIAELRAAGHTIEVSMTRTSGGARIARYVLIERRPHAPAEAVEAEPMQLDIGDADKPRPLSHYDEVM